MLGVPPKSSGGATNRCVMSRLTKCLAPAPFSARSAGNYALDIPEAVNLEKCRQAGEQG